MAPIAERGFHDAAGARWIALAFVPEWYTGPPSGAQVETRFACESHHEEWVPRRRGGSLPE